MNHRGASDAVEAKAQHTTGRIEVTQFGTRGAGGRAVGFHAENGVAVLVTPPNVEGNDDAMRLARNLAEQVQVDVAMQAALAAARAETEAMKERVRSIEAALAEQRRINEAAIAGRRRFFSAVLMKPVVSGDWSGEVWLLDPVKMERGTGLRFASVAEVRAMHPELWVVATTADGVLLDAWGPADVAAAKFRALAATIALAKAGAR